MPIQIDGIFLMKLEFEVFPENSQNLSITLNVSCQNRFPQDDELRQILDFTVNHDSENPPFRLHCTFLSQFRSDGEGEITLKEFAKHNGPAYVVPYARELIANLTSRVGVIPTLVIPPINVLKMLDESGEVVEEQTLGLDKLIESREQADK